MHFMLLGTARMIGPLTASGKAPGWLEGRRSAVTVAIVPVMPISGLRASPEGALECQRRARPCSAHWQRRSGGRAAAIGRTGVRAAKGRVCRILAIQAALSSVYTMWPAGMGAMPSDQAARGRAGERRHGGIQHGEAMRNLDSTAAAVRRPAAAR